MTALKVWRVVLHIPEVRGQAELVVAAPSRIAAARLFGCSDNELKNRGSETGNEVQRSYALAAEGIVFYKPLNDHADNWKPMGGAITADDLTKVQKKVDRVKAIADAKASRHAVWQRFQYGCGARLSLPAGITAVVEYESGLRTTDDPTPKYKVTVGHAVAKARFNNETEAKIAAVAFARQLLNAALSALPTDATLTE